MSLPYTKTIIAFGFLGFVVCMSQVFCGCASSLTGRALNVTVIGSGIADVTTTRQAINSGRGYEANSFFMGQGVWQQSLMKAAGISTVLAGAWLLEQRQHTIWAHVVRGAASAVWAGIAYRNTTIGRTR